MKKILMIISAFFISIAFVSCDSSNQTTISSNDFTTTTSSFSSGESSTSSTSTEASTEVEYFTGTFVLDSNVNVMVYSTQEYSDGVISTVAYAKDSDTGAILTDGDGQINFKVNVTEGYGVLSIIVSPSSSYNSLKTPEELELDNTYRITKITGDVTITITTYLLPDDYVSTEATTISLNNTSVTVTNNNGGVSFANGILTIALGGEYVVSGALVDGAIVINTPDSDVYLTFLDVSITSNLTAPINVVDANNVDIWIEMNRTVTLNDTRSSSSIDEEAPNAALTSSSDLTIDGEGSLVINASYNNGISSKDDLKIKNVTVIVNAYNNGIKGNDSLTIFSGNITITANTGDGLKTENSDLSDKGVQRGVLTISGGTIIINALCDGIDSAYDVVIENDPSISIYTSESYATGLSGSTPNVTQNTLYLRISSSIYSSAYRFAVLFSNPTNTETVWENATYLKSAMISGRTYYFYSITLPTGYSSYTLYRFTSTSSNSETSYNAVSETASINTAYDMLIVGSKDISGTTINISFGLYSSQTSTSTITYSSKGIKADNNVYVDGGTILIYSYDDGIHANHDTLLETSVYGEGSVYISGGDITITTKDDGIHADQKVMINGGAINIITSYEGVEGNQIYVSGGSTTIFSTDDGFNASSGSLSVTIVISGGFVDISVGSGDTDAMDSNGTYVQTGGFVVSRSALSGGMGGALDTNGTVSITGGTFIGIGSSERVATSAGSNRSTGVFSLTISAGTYVVKDSSGNEILSFTTPTNYTYYQMWMSSDLLKSGTSYSLSRNGTSIKTWTQN